MLLLVAVNVFVLLLYIFLKLLVFFCYLKYLFFISLFETILIISVIKLNNLFKINNNNSNKNHSILHEMNPIKYINYVF